MCKMYHIVIFEKLWMTLYIVYNMLLLKYRYELQGLYIEKLAKKESMKVY